MLKIKPTIKPISLILVVHQEVETIERVIKDFYRKVISKIPNSQFIICEDGSTDGTKEILAQMKNRYHLTLDVCQEKRGYTQAMRDGFRLAKNPVIFFSDSDGQHEPNDFWKMYPLLEDFDMVIGWKIKRFDAWYRLLMTYIFNKLISFYFKVKLHDIDCGFRLIKKEAIDFILDQNWRLKDCVNTELTVKIHAAGFKVAELPVTHFSRQAGDSRGLPVQKLPKIIFHILKEFPHIRHDMRKLNKKDNIMNLINKNV